MTTYNCDHCRDTGKRILPNGEHSDYVDCSCQAATERAELDVAVTVFVQSYEGDLQNAPADTRWFVHQRAVKMQAAKVAALQAHVKELEQKHADAVQRYEELAAMPAAPSAPAVEQQPIRWLMSDGSCTADRRYGEGYGGKPLYLAPAPQAADTDKVREVLDKLHAEIMNLPANKLLHIYEDDIGQTLAYKTGHRDARHSAAELAASMAVQAPVREVPGWQPIGDSLPSDDCRVLAATWFDMTQVQQVEVVSFRAGSGTFSDCNVTHWQPLPEPPAAPVQQEPKP